MLGRNSSLTGTLYESNPTTADYVVATPGSWIFAGTGVAAGTHAYASDPIAAQQNLW